MSSISDLLTSVEAADALGIDRGTLTRWVKANRIKVAFERPGIRLFEPAEIERVRATLTADTETTP